MTGAGEVTAWRHARAIALLPFVSTVVIPGALLTLWPRPWDAPSAAKAALLTAGAGLALGGVWLVLRDDSVIGHAVVTYGFDLEHGGADAYLTELAIDPEHRGRGAGAAVLDNLAATLRARDVRALHLQVRPENPARRLYERAGFVTSPRLVMTRPL